MTDHTTVALVIGIALIAFLYSTVGHAGASGYIAVMSLVGIAPAVIKPTALTLNILVACIATWQYWRAGYFDWSLFWPFAITATPLAFVGGYVNLPTHVFKILVGVVLLFSAFRFLLRPTADAEVYPPSRPTALTVGAGLGLLSGLTGTGGGIFLTPLLLFMGWARTKTASAVSATFILANSIAGLAGTLVSTRTFPPVAAPLAIAAVIAGTAGSFLGARRLPPVSIKRLLAIVLLIAGVKLIFTR